MRNVFIDCGANIGKISLEFKDKNPSYEFYLFEPDPALIPHLTKISNENNFKLIEKAVWTENCKKTFYFGKNTEGNTLLIEKERDLRRPEKIRKEIEVECIDFCEWIQNNFSKEDNIYVKMDIEGAEYVLLNKALEDGTIEYIDTLDVEFHIRKLKNYITKKEHNTLYKKLKEKTNLILHK